MALFGASCVFKTINPLETWSPFCWKLCNVDFNFQHYPNLGEAKLIMPNDFKKIKLVRKMYVAQAIFFRTVQICFVKLFVVSQVLINILKMLMLMENQLDFFALWIL